jgi:N-acetyl-beta-hexosaminidase
LAHAGFAHQATSAMTTWNACNASVRDFHAVIKREPSDGPHWFEVMFASQVKGLLANLGRRVVGGARNVPLFEWPNFYFSIDREGGMENF